MLKRHRLFIGLWLIAGLAGCGGGGSSTGGGTLVSDTVRLQDNFPGLATLRSPLAMLAAPGDSAHWHIVEQAGRVLRIADGASTSQVVLDIRDRVEDGPNEAGLLGLAFHPQYASNGRAFASYTRDNGQLESVVSEFSRSADGVTLDPASERIILLVNQDRSNHNGGQIAFGPDQHLYIGLGDGGGSIGRAQDTSTLLGSLLRIDVNGSQPYDIPGGNLFSGNSLCAADHSSISPCPEIYAWGFRNPWRWSFDRQNGELWAGDVGEFSFEEINRVTSGGNYGWRAREGSSCFEFPACNDDNLIDPVHEYGRADGFSVTGGYVYRGSGLSEFSGQYIFGDYATGVVWALNRDSGSRTELIDSSLSISSFAEGSNGELYILDHRGGRVYALLSR